MAAVSFTLEAPLLPSGMTMHVESVPLGLASEAGMVALLHAADILEDYAEAMEAE